MKVLVVGGGGREHAITWRLAQDAAGHELFCAPGNAGTAACATNLAVGAEDIAGIVAWAEANRPDLVVVGPEAPLVKGLVDALQAVGITAFGPVAAGARMEGSKRFAKEIMDAAGVPTGKAETFTDAAAAKAAYVKDPALAEALVAACRAAPARPSQQLLRPAPAARPPAAGGVMERLAACRSAEERCAFAQAHAKEIAAANRQ